MGNWQKQQSVAGPLHNAAHYGRGRKWNDSSVTSGSILAMLTSLLSMGHGDWFVCSPAGVLVGPGRESVPGGRLHERLTPGRDAERSAECQNSGDDAARETATH